MREPLDIEDYLNEQGCFVDKNCRKVRLGAAGGNVLPDKVQEAVAASDFTREEWMRFIRYAENFGMTNGMFTIAAIAVKASIDNTQKR